MSLPSPLSGTTKPFPLLVHQRVPSFEVHLVRDAEAVVFEPDEGAFPHHLPEEGLGLPLAALPGLDDRSQVVDGEWALRLLEYLEEPCLGEIGGEVFFHAATVKDTSPTGEKQRESGRCAPGRTQGGGAP